MWLKNLQTYRLPAPWACTAEQLAAYLQTFAFGSVSDGQMSSVGWVAPRPGGELVHVVAGQYLIRLMTEKRLLPAKVIAQAAAVRADAFEKVEGFRPGKKAMQELKERVADELLPRAFPVRSTTWVWIDPVNGWLVIDAAGAAKADEVVKQLLKAVDRMPLESLRVQRSPVAVMTAWLEMDEAPAGFTVDQDTELRATGESKAAVRYVKHTLEPDDILRHIKQGKQCTRLALTWQDKVSFVLTEQLAIKSVKPLDVMRESTAGTLNSDERFDSDFCLMAGELAVMLGEVVQALGGEARA